MRKLILFKADRGEIEKYRQHTETRVGQSFYRVANAGSVPSLITTIAEHYDSSGKPAPEIGYRLTETVPEDRDSFRDNGWEVVRKENSSHCPLFSLFRWQRKSLSRLVIYSITRSAG